MSDWGFKEIQVFQNPRSGRSTTLRYHRLVECPDCGFRFIQDVETGCFHDHKSPIACPKCNYPWSKMQNTEADIEKAFNPSERK